MKILRGLLLLAGLTVIVVCVVEAQVHMQDQVEHLRTTQTVQDVKIAAIETRLNETERRLNEAEAVKPDVRIGRIEATLESNNRILTGLLISVGVLIVEAGASWITGRRKKMCLVERENGR